jgi:NADPH-dependent curcumin reductase CurA
VRDGGTIVSTLGAPDVGQRDVRTATVMAAPTAQTLTTLAELVAEGELAMKVHSTYELEQIPDAFETFSAGTLGKICITVQ